MKYEVVIGIETHIQLKTQSKMFCGCSADFFNQKPNIHTCPVCLGLPGALPVINKGALEQAMRMGLALNANVQKRAHFDRKNYFYPDLPKGYQISQYDEPLNIGGSIDVEGREIGIMRAHLEEDVGKLTHDGSRSLIDFNKSGVPLMEIVSEPVIKSAAEAKNYVQALRHIARYIGVNDGDLERGTMRADINISLQTPGSYEWKDGEFVVADGVDMSKRVEVKNVNSFRSIERAVEYEIGRQTEILEGGGVIEQETRGWDEAKGKTVSQRSKEEAHDYRYFPEPDLPPLSIDEEWVTSLKSTLPELPQAKKARFVQEYGLGEYDARLLCEEPENANWYEEAVKASLSSADKADPQEGSEAPDKSRMAKLIANWMTGELARLQNEQQILIADSKLTPYELATVIKLIKRGSVSGTSAKQLVQTLFADGGFAVELVKQLGLEQVSSSSELDPIVDQVIAGNQDAVANYQGGKTGSLMYLVGQVMRETRGRANAAEVQKLLESKLKQG